MFVYNRCTTDVRVLREAATLQQAGHEITIVAVLDTTTTPRELLPNGVRILRIDRRPLHYRLVWWVRAHRRGAEVRGRRAARAVALSVLGSDPDGVGPEERSVRERIEDDPRTGTFALARLELIAAFVSAFLRSLSTGARRLLYTAHKPLMYSDFYGRGYRATARAGFDVVHAHDLNTLPVAALLAHRTGARLVYDAHELYPEVSTLSRLERAIWRRLEPKLIRRSDRVITVCDAIAEELSRRYRISTPQVLLNCPPSTEIADPALSPLRRAVGLATGDRTTLVLYQGGFAPNRGLVELVLAMHELDDAILVMMGWGRLEDDLRELVGAQRLHDRVRILGPVHRDQLQLWTAGADIGVIPYQPVGLNNTFATPNKLFEYMSAGIPIVATRLPEITRIVDGHAIGVTFERVTPREIAAAVRRLLTDPAERAAMRRRATVVRDQYTWEHQAERLLTLYEDLGAASSMPSARGRSAC